jgi:hypothetical protein
MPKQYVNSVLVDLTEEEIASNQAHFTENINQQNAANAAREQKAIKKASGNQKLLDLGLSQSEIDALTGA